MLSEIDVDDQIMHICWKTVDALPIHHLTSISASQSNPIVLPRYVNLSTYLMLHSSTLNGRLSDPPIDSKGPYSIKVQKTTKMIDKVVHVTSVC